MNDGQRLLGEDLNAHTALEQYRFPVVVVVVVLCCSWTYERSGDWLLDLGETLEVPNLIT